ncbi:YraN family protein [Demequina gelatinilytica]|uniref:YraN family protein n=1 Tax=Demequina gelatinilytica TaxID=1638980 RepID=UPI000785DB5D|nr:YraN family protein [Demequina gelatinilytica]
MAVKDAVGRYGEDLVVRTLAEDGWEVLARNWRCPLGEIDIVARDGTAVVFVEVKTRRSDAFGGALAAVTRGKLARLRLLAGEWVAGQAARWPEMRIDVVGVTIPRSGRAVIEHLRGVG